MRKEEKGITLIALVVTIVVLLILAGVSISMLTGENGIINQALEAKEETKKQSEIEQIKMEIIPAYDAISGNYNMDQIKENLKKNLGINNIVDYERGTIKFVFENEEFFVEKSGEVYKVISLNEAKSDAMYSENKNTFVKDDENSLFIVPGGFRVADESINVGSGIVIQDSIGNEFVWVPVNNVSATSTEEANSSKAMALLDSSTGNYSGIMYDITVEEDNIVGSTVRTTNYYEPKLATWSDTDEKLAEYGYESKEEFLETMQKEYNDMIESVNYYKGFYIGRYETSVNDEGDVQSKKGVYPFSGSGANWYKLYEKQKTFYSNFVTSSMIWGSQYDAMLNWVISGNNKNNLLGITRSETEKVACGSEESDIINQIYDLTGNTFEWTLAEGAELNARMSRGAYFGITGNALRRGYTVSGYSGEMNGSRMTLYIK